MKSRVGGRRETSWVMGRELTDMKKDNGMRKSLTIK